MAETTTKTAAPRKPPTRRPSVKKPAAVPRETTSTTEETAAPRAQSAPGFELLVPHPQGDTKRYSRWVGGEGATVFGTVYAPLGTTRVSIVAE